MKDVTYTITGTAISETRLDLSARDFTIIVDEPERLGGTNTGPNPLEYELASLGGCFNVTGHLVAKEMGFSIRDLTISLTATLNPARFMGRGGEERAGFKEITATLAFESTADVATLEQWCAAVEERCPVSDNLSSGTNVHLKLKH